MDGLSHAALLNQLRGDVVGFHVARHAVHRQCTKFVGGSVVQPPRSLHEGYGPQHGRRWTMITAARVARAPPRLRP